MSTGRHNEPRDAWFRNILGTTHSALSNVYGRVYLFLFDLFNLQKNFTVRGNSLDDMNRTIIVFFVAVIMGYSLIDNFNPEVLQGKRVFITGASTGIGEQMAYHYAKLGAHVVVTARGEARLQQVVEKCRELGPSQGIYNYVVADMSDLPSIAEKAQTAVEMLGGRLDYLVLNHIIPAVLGEWVGSNANFTLLDKTLDINFRAYAQLSSTLLPHLEQSAGQLVVVSSVAGKIAQPYLIPYVTSKFALDGFFSGLRHELSLRNSPVSVTVCIIGLIGTESAMKNLRSFGLDHLLSVSPIADPADAAMAIIRGGVTRAREIYFPYMQARPLIILRDIFPTAIDFLQRDVFARN